VPNDGHARHENTSLPEYLKAKPQLRELKID